MTRSIIERARPEILSLRGYSSARMEAKGGSVLLNANESPWPAPSDRSDALHRYPDPQPPALIARLAAIYGVAPDSVLAGRGSDEAIDLLTRAFCRAGIDEVIVSPPTFGMYEVSAAIQNARVVAVPLNAGRGFAYPFAAVLAAVTPETKLVYVCTPNNPTGTAVSREDVLALAGALDGRALVIVDEAYIDFTTAPSVIADIASTPNLAVLRTLSKGHALAAARVGALIAAAPVIALLRKLMAPYPLPQGSVDAALAALSDAALAATGTRIRTLVAERDGLAARLASLPDVVAVIPSDANFITARFVDAPAVYRRLLAAGIVVRNVGHHAALAGCLRISIGTPEENRALLDELERRRA